MDNFIAKHRIDNQLEKMISHVISSEVRRPVIFCSPTKTGKSTCVFTEIIPKVRKNEDSTQIIVIHPDFIHISENVLSMIEDLKETSGLSVHRLEDDQDLQKSQIIFTTPSIACKIASKIEKIKYLVFDGFDLMLRNQDNCNNIGYIYRKLKHETTQVICFISNFLKVNMGFANDLFGRSDYYEIQFLNEDQKNTERRFQDLSREIEEKNNMMRNMEETIEQKNNMMRNMEETIKQKNNMIRNMEETIEQKNNMMRNMEETIEQKNNMMRNMEETIEQLRKQNIIVNDSKTPRDLEEGVVNHDQKTEENQQLEIKETDPQIPILITPDTQPIEQAAMPLEDTNVTPVFEVQQSTEESTINQNEPAPEDSKEILHEHTDNNSTRDQINEIRENEVLNDDNNQVIPEKDEANTENNKQEAPKKISLKALHYNDNNTTIELISDFLKNVTTSTYAYVSNQFYRKLKDIPNIVLCDKDSISTFSQRITPDTKVSLSSMDESIGMWPETIRLSTILIQTIDPTKINNICQECSKYNPTPEFILIYKEDSLFNSLEYDHVKIQELPKDT